MAPSQRLTGTARAAVLGSPISHSLSPVLHSAAYAELGLTDWDYRAIECTEQEFVAWFARLGSEWHGLSLTMPLKRVVLPLLAQTSPLAQAVGAVNTVTWTGAGQDRQPVGDNTDVPGIVAALVSVGVDPVPPGTRRAVVLGTGATACSAVAAAAHLGCTEVILLGRAPDRAGEPLAVAERLGLRASATGLADLDPVLAAELVISTLPAGPAADWAELLPSRRPAGVLLDVSYHPWPTTAAVRWRALGGTAVGGFEMLLHQAAAQVTLMTGQPAPLAAMRAAGTAALRVRSD